MYAAHVAAQLHWTRRHLGYESPRFGVFVADGWGPSSSTPERLQILAALIIQIRTDATVNGEPSRHLLLALAAHASSWAAKVES